MKFAHACLPISCNFCFCYLHESKETSLSSLNALFRAHTRAYRRTTVAQKVHASMEPQSHLAKPPRAPLSYFMAVGIDGVGGPWYFLVFEKLVNHNSTRGKIMLTTLIIVPPSDFQTFLRACIYISFHVCSTEESMHVRRPFSHIPQTNHTISFLELIF